MSAIEVGEKGGGEVEVDEDGVDAKESGCWWDSFN
jgi:hypothetical protein